MGVYPNVTLEMVYQKLLHIEETVKEIDADLHRLRPEFVEKLKRIEEEKSHTFSTLEEMEKHMDESED